MSIKILNKYINKCQEIGIKPTFQGLKIYRLREELKW